MVPIVCVDLLPWREENNVVKLGLIRRLTPTGGSGYALVGGRVRRGEELGDAIRRHLADSLGTSIDYQPPEVEQPATIGQYFPQRRRGYPWDPRKHAVALSYTVEVSGIPKPRGEALGFEWFAPDAIPAGRDFGFGQDIVVKRLAEGLKRRGGLSGPLVK